MTASLTTGDLEALTAFDSPTICNALEILMPERRSLGFNRRPLFCPTAAAKPVVGYARTATIRSREPLPLSKAEVRKLRLGWYGYVAEGPQPSLAVLQDVDGPDTGFGAFWGEIQTNLHQALGCVGTVTDGSIRDIDAIAPGFFMLAGSIMPSHGHVEVVDFGKAVSVAGMVVAPGDLIHADRHGAVVVPVKAVKELPATCNLLARREKVILEACRAPGFSVTQLEEIFARMDDIH